MTSRLADFYIIGAMKCATSTLHEQLARREKFFLTEPKEPNFFNEAQLVRTEFSAYEALFAHARSDQITGESSTHYSKLPTYEGTAARIFEHTPEARFVYVMRDPVERLVSQYVHEWTENKVDVPVSQAIDKYPRLMAYSCYAMQLKPYLDLFGKERVLPVFFEYLVRNKETELKRVARFLGDDTDEPFVWHKEAAQTNVSKERLRKSAFREKVLSFPVARRVKNALPSQLKERIKSVWRMEKRPELTDAALHRLKSRLDRDLAELGGLMGLELTCDRFAEVARGTQPNWDGTPASGESAAQ